MTSDWTGAALAAETRSLLARMGVPAEAISNGTMHVSTPITGEVIARLTETGAADAEATIAAAHDAFLAWRSVPAPRRGELVRLLGEELRAAKDDLGRLVTIEAGKITSEGLGEVQEMIDICDFAVGLSRQLYGVNIASERPDHRLMEQYHPLGAIGVITAFNFPVAPWAWNAALALVCGDPVVWKPSEKTPLTALAVQALVERAMAKFGDEAPNGLTAVVLGGSDVGDALVSSPKLPLISATGSTAMGRIVGPRLAQRFARAVLELGGNNASIVAPSADLDLAVRAIAFAAMGTAGQRCTTLRRLIVHESIYAPLVERLAKAYASVTIGDPREAGTLVGPLIDVRAFADMEETLEQVKELGGKVHGGGRVLQDRHPDAYYVRPALVELAEQTGPVLKETFAPILYVMPYREIEDAIAIQNGVSQGLSSSIFSNDLREVERFLSASGSDCGLANVNMGPSGAEIGGAFGGEKETGGGREAGSDSWKAYMRRTTSAINYGKSLPLAQGVKFDIG